MEAKTNPEPKLPLWWVSFCDTRKPEGEQFVGVVVVRAVDMEDAFKEACKIEGVPRDDCKWPRVCTHIDTQFVQSDRTQEYRIEHLMGRFVPRDEVLAMPSAVGQDDYREFGDE